MKKFSKFITTYFFLILAMSFTSSSIEGRSLLHEVYLSKGELDAQLICHGFFPLMTPEQINEGIKDIRKFLKEYVIENLSNIDEFLIKSVLHAHGHIIRFLEEAYVHKKTGKVFRPRPKNMSASEFIGLIDYWKMQEKKTGAKIYYPKFFATCIDYLSILLRAFFSYQCTSYQKLNEVEHQWLYWMGKVEKHIDSDPIFGAYYNENLILFREIFNIWLEEFNKIEVAKKRHNQSNKFYM